MFGNSQKGISLIITFFIMVIILSAVLAISAILYSEIKIIRNIGNSVAAFYLADSGVEKTLYYDRQEIPEEASRGICNICETSSGWAECSDNEGESCADCTNCRISFDVTMSSSPLKKYNVVADVLTPPASFEQQCPVSTVSFQSYGTYINTKRAIKLDITNEVRTGLGPGISGAQAIFQGQSGHVIDISAYVDDPEGDLTIVNAYIYDHNRALVAPPSPLELVGGGQDHHYSRTWSNAVEGETYFVSIGAFDANGYCASITVTPQ